MENPADADPPAFLTGQILIAMPGMTDPRFMHALVYLCGHSSDGAMGLIINKKTDGLIWRDLFGKLDIALPDHEHTHAVRYGGPVETGRGFVLHSADYTAPDATMEVDEGISMTASADILHAISDGQGPTKVLITLGYAGWGPGQLERELRQNAWLACRADAGMIFSDDDDSKWSRALHTLGVNPALLSTGGHA